MEEYRKYEPIFGSWYLNRLIGKGSFGKVFEIIREEYGTTYRSALKIITIPQDDDDVKTRMTEGSDIKTVSEYYEGILREIINENEIMAQLKGNSNIVSYEDHQIIPHGDGIGYDILIRMELLTPLIDRMIEKRLDEKDVVKLGIDICKALEICHKKNIIHRDIKPQNIFISDNGDYKLGDFGIARTMEKTTGGMSKKGTYKYMAPEVFRGEDYDSTVDIYSLGIVLYSLLNGNRGPFLPPPPAKVTHNDEDEARLRRFRGEPLPPPRDAGPMLAYVIQKACANDPLERYRTAGQMRRDLESYLNNYGLQADTASADLSEEDTVLDESIRGYTGSYAGRYTGRYNTAGSRTGSVSYRNNTGSGSADYSLTRRHEQEIRERQERERKMKLAGIIGGAALAVVILLGVIIFKVVIPQHQYNTALEGSENGNYSEASSEDPASRKKNKQCIALYQKVLDGSYVPDGIEDADFGSKIKDPGRASFAFCRIVEGGIPVLAVQIDSTVYFIGIDENGDGSLGSPRFIRGRDPAPYNASAFTKRKYYENMGYITFEVQYNDGSYQEWIPLYPGQGDNLYRRYYKKMDEEHKEHTVFYITDRDGKNTRYPEKDPFYDELHLRTDKNASRDILFTQNTEEARDNISW